MSVSSWLYDLYTRLAPKARQREVERIIGPLGDLSGKRVLEVGAGTCRVCSAIKLKFPDAQVFASDRSREHLRRGAGKADITTMVCHTEELAGELEGSFDAVLGVDTIHHHRNRMRALENCRRLLRDGGTLLLREVDRLDPASWRYALVDKTDYLFSKLQGLPYLSPSYFSRGELTDMLEGMGFHDTWHEYLGRAGLFLLTARK